MDASVWLFLADCVLVAHALLAAAIVLAFPAIWLGAALGWAWVRRPLFRLSHLAAMGSVLLETVLGRNCPLTGLEDRFRLLARAEGRYAETFVQYWAGRLFYVDIAGPWVLPLYFGFFALLVLTLVFVPIRRHPRNRESL